MNWLFNRKLEKLQEKRRATAANYARIFRKALKAGKSKGELEEIESEGSFEDQLADEEIQAHLTYSLMRRARRLSVSTPARDDEKYWRSSQLRENIRYLNADGILLVTETVRLEEQKRRDERIAHLDVTGRVVVLVTGLVGALIGLVSIFKK